jgi:serine/threonine-protein kinase RsbW
MTTPPETVADDGLPEARPDSTFREVEQWRLSDLDELTTLRRELQARLDPAGASAGSRSLDDTAEKMVLVASELATNALRHGLPPTIVRLLRHEATWLLDVADHDLESAPAVDGARAPGAGGLGLKIARQLALDVGWYVTDRSKHVWATLGARV